MRDDTTALVSLRGRVRGFAALVASGTPRGPDFAQKLITACGVTALQCRRYAYRRTRIRITSPYDALTFDDASARVGRPSDTAAHPLPRRAAVASVNLFNRDNNLTIRASIVSRIVVLAWPQWGGDLSSLSHLRGASRAEGLTTSEECGEARVNPAHLPRILIGPIVNESISPVIH